MLFSNEYPSFFRKNAQLSYASHSMEKSRLNRPQQYSRTICALDLSVDERTIALTMNKVMMPIGISESLDRTALYERLIDDVLTIVENKKKSEVISSVSILKKLQGYELDIFSSIEAISDRNTFAYMDNRLSAQREYAFRIWFKSGNQLISRVLLLLFHSPAHELASQNNAIQGFQRLFGNVDVFLIPHEPMMNSLQSEWVFQHNDKQTILELHPRFLVNIAHHLDHGQRLNLSEFKQLGFSDSVDVDYLSSVDPYQHYLLDFKYYAATVPNGWLMYKSISKAPFVAHQTPYKHIIAESKELRVSRAGCMGNMVYTTLLVGDQEDVIGGHAIGLYKRKYEDMPLKKDNYILLQAQHNKNRLTNWIEKLGRGRLFLEARNSLLFSDEKRSRSLSQRISENTVSISAEVILQYGRLYPLLNSLNLYSTVVKSTELGWSEHIEEKMFSLVIALMEKIACPQDGAYHSVVNNIFFEIIKDYILLFQSDENSVKFCSQQSFNMDNQYAIFFELCPELKIDWNTGSFPVNIHAVFNVLKTHHLIVSREEEYVFKVFFLDRLAYYINVSCLEGCQKLPRLEQVKTFEDLANMLPNLTGIIYNDLIKRKYKKTPFIELYSHHLRECYDTSYDERDIDVLVKCGFSGTEEIGVRASASVRFFDFEILKKDEFFHSIQLNDLIPLDIKGVSNQNGFTNRF